MSSGCCQNYYFLCYCSLTVLKKRRCLPLWKTFKDAGNLAGCILLVIPFRHGTVQNKTVQLGIIDPGTAWGNLVKIPLRSPQTRFSHSTIFHYIWTLRSLSSNAHSSQVLKGWYQVVGTTPGCSFKTRNSRALPETTSQSPTAEAWDSRHRA